MALERTEPCQPAEGASARFVYQAKYETPINFKLSEEEKKTSRFTQDQENDNDAGVKRKKRLCFNNIAGVRSDETNELKG